MALVFSRCPRAQPRVTRQGTRRTRRARWRALPRAAPRQRSSRPSRRRSLPGSAGSSWAWHKVDELMQGCQGRHWPRRSWPARHCQTSMTRTRTGQTPRRAAACPLRYAGATRQRPWARTTRRGCQRPTRAASDHAAHPPRAARQPADWQAEARAGRQRSPRRTRPPPRSCPSAAAVRRDPARRAPRGHCATPGAREIRQPRRAAPLHAGLARLGLP